MIRIGVVFEKSLNAGGGYQIELATLKAIQEFGGKYKFFVYSPGQANAALKPANHISYRFYKPTNLGFRMRSRICRITWELLPELYFKYFHCIDPLAMQFESDGIDLIYFLGPNSIAPRQSIPFIFTVWDLQHRLQPEFPEVSKSGTWEAREKLYWNSIGKAYAVVCDSEVGRKQVSAFYCCPETKTYSLPYIHNYENLGAEAQSGDAKVLAKNNLESGYFFYPSVFWPHKNHMVLLEALCLLRDSGKPVPTLAFSGDKKGNYATIEVAIKKWNLEAYVRMLGFVDGGDMPALYRNASGLVMPTFFGPTNIPVCEAFHFGCPVVTSDIDGIRQQAQQDAILANPLEAKDWANAMALLSSSVEARQDYRQRGLARSTQYQSKNYWEILQGIFESFRNKQRVWRS